MGETVSCPCCCDDMTADMVVCWICYRESNRLSLGMPEGPSWVSPVTQELVDRWESARAARLAAMGIMI